jgi:hypothetical protein
MTAVNKLKQALAEAARETTGAPSVGYALEAYARHWPFVVTITDWDIWNDSKRALRVEVIRWLERHEDAYDFWQFRDGYGLVGFKDLKAATRFELRWSGKSPMMSASAREWSPHPVSSTFEAPGADEVRPVAGASRQHPGSFYPGRTRRNKPVRSNSVRG